jgi:hypothetical protein
MDNTILYLTDNSLSTDLALQAQDILVNEARGIPIVSVSQKPIELGTNICVGEIGRSWLSLYKQMLAGLNAITTKYVVIAEHDCLYSNEHLSWTPPSDDTFYYNHNHWLVQWGGNHPELNGMYSRISGRVALSQLISNKELLKESIQERLSLLEKGFLISKGLTGAGEPGVVDNKAVVDLETARRLASCGRAVQLQGHIGNYLKQYTCSTFKTVIPNIDIRHNSNFTGARRGKDRCYELPYWGKFEDVINNSVLA